jgi:hypothetical protein
MYLTVILYCFILLYKPNSILVIPFIKRAFFKKVQGIRPVLLNLLFRLIYFFLLKTNVLVVPVYAFTILLDRQCDIYEIVALPDIQIKYKGCKTQRFYSLMQRTEKP